MATNRRNASAVRPQRRLLQRDMRQEWYDIMVVYYLHGQTGRCTVLAKQWGKRITPDGQFHSGLLDRHQAIFYLPFNRIFRKPFVNGKQLTSTYRVYDQCKRTFRPGLAVAFLQNQYNFFDSKCLFTCCSWVTILSQFSLPIPPIAVPLLISTEKPAA